MPERTNPGRGPLSSPGVRWSLLAGIVIIGLVVALVSTLGDESDPYAAEGGADGAASVADEAPPATREVLDAGQREAAALPGCAGPDGAQASAQGEFAQFVVGCMSDGEDLTLAELQGGRPMVLNMWAYWCAPCRHELPALQEAQRTLGDDVRVATVHADASETKGLSVLEELGIELVATEDPEERLAVETGAPPVLPLTLFLHPDGEVAHLLVEPMYNERDVLDAVEEHLGVSA